MNGRSVRIYPGSLPNPTFLFHSLLKSYSFTDQCSRDTNLPQIYTFENVVFVRTTEFLVGAIWTVHVAVTHALPGQADAGVVGTHTVGHLADQGLTVVLVRVVLAVAVTVAHPGLTDAACWKRFKRRERDIFI